MNFLFTLYPFLQHKLLVPEAQEGWDLAKQKATEQKRAELQLDEHTNELIAFQNSNIKNRPVP